MIHPDSPALHYRSPHYPAVFNGMVPSKIRMRQTVRVDPGLLLARPELKDTIAYCGELYDVWVNSHGAVAAVLPDGGQLGVKPGEFEVVEFYRGEAIA
ncbi:MAG TPA: hypothetical protein VK797_23530 [Tepidisphaeraceae bacterium]|jgi:hypothetical protein|nr:hypothetical protein [Tepidisphaeraceae bacterium]